MNTADFLLLVQREIDEGLDDVDHVRLSGAEKNGVRASSPKGDESSGSNTNLADAAGTGLNSDLTPGGAGFGAQPVPPMIPGINVEVDLEKA